MGGGLVGNTYGDMKGIEPSGKLDGNKLRGGAKAPLLLPSLGLRTRPDTSHTLSYSFPLPTSDVPSLRHDIILSKNTLEHMG